MSKNIYAENYKSYLEKGLSVIPDKYQSKAPAIKAWSDFCYKLPSAEESSHWAEAFKESGIALALGEASGIIALDFDAEDQEIIDLVERLLPNSPVEKKGSKGWTRFFRYTPGSQTEILKYNGKVVFEILSSGKKTTLAPSIHPNGASYLWTSEDTLLSINKEDLPILPPALVSTIQSMLKEKLGAEDQGYGKVSNGRNSELGTYLGNLLNSSTHSADSVLRELIEYDKKINTPPYFSDPNEHRHTNEYTNALEFYSSHLSSINAKRMRENKEYLEPIMESVTNMEFAKESAGKKSVSKVEEKSLKKADSILADSAIKTIFETINKNSWVQQPEMALGAALAIIATLGCRKFTFQGLAPNLYICNISESGSGKNASLDFTRRLFTDLKCQYLLGAGDYVSNASLVDSLPLRQVRLDVMDEVGGKLKTMTSGKTEYADKIGDILAELYTSSNSFYMGRALAGQNGVPLIRGATDKPCVNILSATTPTGFREGVTKDAIAKGLLGRFLFFFGDPTNKSTRVKDVTPLPERAFAHLEKLSKFNFSKNIQNALSNKPNEICELEATEEADILLDKIFQEFDGLRLSKMGKAEAPIAARLYQQMIKLVIIHSLARPFGDVPIIGVQDVQFGYSMIMTYYAELEGIISTYIFNSKLEKDRYEVFNVIKQYGKVRAYTLVRETPQFSNRIREGLIEELLAAEMIGHDMVLDDTLGKKVVIYYTKGAVNE